MLALQSTKQPTSRNGQVLTLLKGPYDIRESVLAQIGHTHGLERRLNMDRVDRHDVRVLEFGKAIRLPIDPRGDLQCNFSTRQQSLFRKSTNPNPPFPSKSTRWNP